MKNFFISITILFLTITVTQAQNTAKLQSIFIYNFIKLIEWPAAYKSGTFNIVVLGNDPIYTELTNLAKVKKVGSQTIKVTKVNSISNIRNPHVLYVPKNKKDDIATAKETIGNKSTLLISDSPDGIDNGSDINFIIIGNKPKFEIRTSTAQSKGLKVSTSLINLGIKK